jgi:hypothetical protein
MLTAVNIIRECGFVLKIGAMVQRADEILHKDSKAAPTLKVGIKLTAVNCYRCAPHVRKFSGAYDPGSLLRDEIKR